MYIGRIVGRVVATQKYPTLQGMKLLVIQPTDSSGKDDGDSHVAVDTIGTGAGEWVYLVSSKDAGLAFEEELVPVDAAIVGIIDQADLSEVGVKIG
ncbi:MAG: EutN/CcmL family microcompartment protein [Halanaerobiales bacterium]|nr:EutN/CcmL family microcompartment protein [Halanaerobiales bacterium]